MFQTISGSGEVGGCYSILFQSPSFYWGRICENTVTSAFLSQDPPINLLQNIADIHNSSNILFPFQMFSMLYFAALVQVQLALIFISFFPPCALSESSLIPYGPEDPSSKAKGNLRLSNSSCINKRVKGSPLQSFQGGLYSEDF